MKAIVYHRYGSPDVLSLQEVPRPEPRDGEVRVRIHAASVTAGDWHMLRGKPFMVRVFFGLLKPRNPILGFEMAGRVEAVGGNVTAFKPGDEVFGSPAPSGQGTFAEYVCAPETLLVNKPAGTSFEEAAAVPASGITALQALRDRGHVEPGERVLINGASGGVGTFAVQIAKALGAEVTAVCSADKMDLVRGLGADHVIDYKKEDFTESGRRYDVIVAVNGYHPILHYRRALAPGGRFVMVGGGEKQMYQAMFFGPWISLAGGKKMGILFAKPTHRDLEALRDLIASGRVKTVIDRRYPLHEVPDAIRYVEAGHARGKVVIMVAEG